MSSRHVVLVSFLFALGCDSKDAAPRRAGEPAPPPLASAATATAEEKDKMAESPKAAPTLAARPPAAEPAGGAAPRDFGLGIGAAGGSKGGPGTGSGQSGLAVRERGPAPMAPAPRGASNLAADDLPAAPVPKLDPNARYATTYRPGGAALAAFDAAVARGDIPQDYKDLVGDFGARYAPPMDAPKEAALALKIETDRAKVPPSGGPVNLRVALRSSASATARAPLSVHLVLDVSGSMSGPAIDNARRAAKSLVERLEARDDFSLVTFSSSAQVLVPDGPVGPRKQNILKQIEEIQANGGTNISSGLDLGYAEAHKPGISPEAVKIVMLLSDGHANGGETSPAALSERSARAFQDGIQTSAFGLGADFDAPLMGAIADRGAGGYYYLADSTQIAGALAKELDARLVPSALAVEVRVRLRPDVTPTHVFGSRVLDAREAQAVRAQEVAVDVNAQKRGVARDRQEDAAGGMRFFMPAFARDDRHAILLTVSVPPGSGERPLASVEVRYKDRVRKKNVTDEQAVKIAFAASDAESASTANPSVVATVQAFTAGDTIVAAERLVDAGRRDAAMRLLQERAEILKRASGTLGEPRLGDDAIRLARLSRAVGDGPVKDALPLAVLLRGTAYGYLR